MRVVHTSDWHLGRAFGPMSLRAEQEAFCDWFVAMALEHGAELVVIAGDLYDRAIAPTESIELFRSTVRRLRDADIAVAAISGNHDGADRVSPYDDLLDAAGVFVRGGYEGVGRVVTLQFADGPLDLVLVPFLDPQAAPDGFGDTAEHDLGERRRRRTHQSVLNDAIALARSALTSERSLLVAHAFVTGAEVSDSERQLEVGGTGSVESTVFDGFSYVALGHLHRPQSIGRLTLRYSGTPLAYSFSEEHPKSVVVVDMDTTGNCSVEEIPVPIGRGVTTLRGEIAELLRPDFRPDAAERFVRAIITDRETVLDAKARLERVYPNVVEIRLEPVGRTGPIDEITPVSIDRVTPLDATLQFWEALEGSPPDDETEAVLRGAVEHSMRVPS